MTAKIKVLLVEDHFMARLALRSILSDKSDVSIVAETDNGQEAIQLYAKLRPDVTVMDLGLPGTDGFDAIASIRQLNRSAKIVVLTNYDGSEDVYRALRNGAMAYLTKDTSGQELIHAIVSAYQGNRYLPRAVRDRLAERIPCSELTPREEQVLKLISGGCSNQEIATKLEIAEKTVRIHVSSVLEKLGARDRTQAAIYAIQRGFVHLD
jgi:Response regulator containing a CheY-like receiver domain and an HTH DNA-binding domain